MVLNAREMINIISDLSEVRGLRVTIYSSAKGAAITGGSTFVGGMLGGPVGMVIGGLIGVAATASRGYQFRPLPEVLLSELTAAQQAMLVNRVNNIIQDFDIADAITMSTLLLTNEGIKRQIVGVVSEFVRTELQMQLT